MTELQYVGPSGEPLDLSADGRFAYCPTEFTPWSVRPLVGGVDALFVRLGGRGAELEVGSDGLQRLPIERWKKKKHFRNAGPAAGLLRLWDNPDCEGEPLAPVLVIRPTLPPQFHKALLHDLGRLLIGISTSVVFRLGQGGFEETGRVPSQLDLLISRAEEMIAVEMVLSEHLPLIDARPARKLVRRVAFVDQQSAARRGLRALSGASRPGAERALISVETLDTAEAEYIVAMQHDLADEAGLLRSALVSEFAGLQNWLTDDRGRLADSPVEVLRDRVEAATSHLAMIENRRPHGLRPQRVPKAGNRLVQSPEYGPPVRAWMAYLERWPSDLRIGEGLYSILEETAVAATSSLYERWMIVRIYAALVEVGFVPASGSDLLADIRVAGGELKIPRGTSWVLRRSDGLRVRLTAEPEVPLEGRVVTPDALLEVASLDNRQPRGYVFDAKFRDYEAQSRQISEYEAGERLTEPYLYEEVKKYGGYAQADRLGTIRDKYLRIEGVVAGFLIHPDARPEYEVWDDRFDRDDFPQDRDTRPHEAVACPWVPGSPKLEMEVTKVLTCIFGFHENQRDLCWRCGVHGEVADEEMVAITRRTVGNAYRCPSCTAFWVDTWCHRDGRHRPLLKMGLRSFHRFRRENPYDVACPWCAAMLRDWSRSDFTVAFEAGQPAEILQAGADDPF